MSKLTAPISMLLAGCLSFSGMVHGAQATLGGAALIGTEQAIAAPAQGDSAAREQLLSTLERADVAAALSQRGVSVDQARARVAALSDAEAAHVAQQIDQAPAGADGVIGTIVFIFVLLLVTDILGFTKIFPFTRSIR
jgi:hypothetical protein